MKWSKGALALALLTLGAVSMAQSVVRATNDPLSDDKAASAPVDKSSVKSIQAYIQQKRKEADALKARAQAGEPINPQAISRANKAAEWWEAYLYDYQLKAYPNDRVDYRKYIEGMRHRSRMAPAPIQRDPRDTTGGNWSFVGPRNLDVPYQTYWGLRPVSGRVSAIAISAQDTSVWYVAGATGGVFLTTDGGATYVSRSASWEMLEVSSLECDPNDGDIIYAGTGDHAWGTSYGMGIMKSTNRGSSWTNVGRTEMEGNAVSDIEVWPASTNTVLAATGRGADGTGQVWRSADAGATWTAVITTLADWHEISHGAVSGGYRNVWVVGTTSGGSMLLRRSQNFGSSWTTITPPAGATGIGSIAASKVDRDTVYLLSCGNNRIYKSTNAGTSWSDITAGFPNGTASDPDYNWSQDTYDWYIECGQTSSATDLVVVGLISLAANRGGTANNWVSVGDETWSGSNLTHNDQHSVCLHPTLNDRFFFGNDGGFYQAIWFASPINTWAVANYNERLPITHFYEFDSHPTSLTSLIGGTQDNATPVARGDLNNWDNVVGGDGGGCAINQTTTNRQYGTSQRYGYSSATGNATIGRTTDGWATTANFTIPMSGESIPFIGQLHLAPGLQSTGYVGTNYLHRFVDSGVGVVVTTRLGNFNFGATVSAIAVAPSDNNRIYVGLSDGDIWMSTNGGGAWDQIDNEGPGAEQPPNRAVTGISISPTNSDFVVFTFAGFGSGSTATHVYRTTTATAEPVVWINANGTGSTGLPNVPHRSVVRDPYQPGNILYVANDLGVFYSDDFGGTWYEMTTTFGLPNVQVRELNVSGNSQYLYAATWGRGAYRMPLASSAPTVASVDANPEPVLGGNDISCTVTLSRDAPPGGQVVAVTSSNTALIPNFSVTVPGGASSATRLFIQTQPPTTDTNVTLSAAGQSDVILVEAVTFSAFTVSPSDITGGNSTTGTVTISPAAPQTGIVINVSDNSSFVTTPTTISVPSGATSANFTITTTTPSSDVATTVTATRGATTFNRTLTLRTVSIASVVISPDNVFAGQGSTATITLNRAAPTIGTTVALTSNNPSAASVPANVGFTSGQTVRSVSISTGPVTAPTNVTITANPPGSNGFDTITVNPVLISGTITLNDVTVPSMFVRPVNLRVWAAGTFPPAAPILTRTQNVTFINGLGSYSAPIGFIGRMEFSAKTSHWLRDRVGPFNITTSAGLSNVNFTLINGDVEPNNEVNIDDFLAVAGTYEEVPPSDIRADLNEDGAVNIDDFLILAAAYELVGEE